MPKASGSRATRRHVLAGGALMATGLCRPAIAKSSKLTYWSPLDPLAKNNRSQAEANMIAVFRRSHPDVQIEVQPIPWQVMGQQVMQAVMAGNGPDVAQLSNTNLSDQVAAGIAMPLDKYVGRGWTQADRDDFVLPWDNTVYDGQKMAFYWNTQLNNQIWYLQEDVGELPMEFARFAERLAALSEKSGKIGYLTGLSVDGNGDQFTNWLIPMLWSAGVEYVNPDRSLGFINDTGEQVFNLFLDMVRKYRIVPSNIVALNRDNVLSAFNNRKAYAVMMASNIVSGTRAVLGDGFRTSMQPGFGGPTPSLSAGKFLMMTRTAQDPVLAGEFIEAMVSREAQLANTSLSLELPCRKSVLTDAWFATPAAADVKAALDYIVQKRHPFRYERDSAWLGDRILVATQAMVAGRPVRDRLKQIDAEWQQQRG